MNVMFNKNERIISGKAALNPLNNALGIKNLVTLGGQSRNLQKSYLGTAQSRVNQAAPQNTFNKTTNLNGSHIISHQTPTSGFSRNIRATQLIKSSLGFAKTQNNTSAVKQIRKDMKIPKLYGAASGVSSSSKLLTFSFYPQNINGSIQNSQRKSAIHQTGGGGIGSTTKMTGLSTTAQKNQR